MESSDVFLSYSREDQERLRKIFSTLHENTWFTIWWDKNLRAGQSFPHEIDRALRAAKVVIVFWSEASVRSEYVFDEASRAKIMGKLLPVLIDDVVPPLGFGTIETIDLRGLRDDKSKADRLIRELSTRFSDFPGTILVDEQQAVDLKIAQQVARDIRVAVFYDMFHEGLTLQSLLISLSAFGFTVLDASGGGEYHGEWASELRAAAADADVFVVPLLPSAFGIRYCDIAMGAAGVSKPLAVACISSMSVEQAREQLANREWATDARYAHLDMPALNLHHTLVAKSWDFVRLLIALKDP
jgi:TIR domain-containing protein